MNKGLQTVLVQICTSGVDSLSNSFDDGVGLYDGCGRTVQTKFFNVWEPPMETSHMLGLPVTR
jgi:hypothetical protein